jgi:hypothetical protein
VRARGACISPGGGMITIFLAVRGYERGRNWSPRGIIFVDGKAAAEDWTIRPVWCESFVGAIAFRETAGGAEMVAFRDVDGCYHALNALVTLNCSEAMIVRMSGRAVLEWALPVIRSITKHVQATI